MITSISDVHIKKPGDKPYRLMINFLGHEKTKASAHVLLLGDIFDLFVGGNKKFLEDYSEIFILIDKLLSEGKKVYYLEGNHDFHIGKILKERFPGADFCFSTTYQLLSTLDKKIMICHGDDIEIENPSYRAYSSIIKSFPIKFLAESVVPFEVTKKIGEWASGRSRKKNISSYEKNLDKIKDKFRRSAEVEYKKHNFDVLIAGHSHVKDAYSSENKFLYLNNGFAPLEKTFLSLDEKGHSFISLSESSH